MKKKKKKRRRIDAFRGKYFFLSNFYPGDRTSLEHQYQACKALTEKDRRRVLRCKTPGDAKRLARTFEHREDWESVKVEIMWLLLYIKFQNRQLRKRLLATGNAILVEGNWWHDNFWGACTCDRCINIHGENTLGKLHMKLRRRYRGEKSISFVV